MCQTACARPEVVEDDDGLLPAQAHLGQGEVEAFEHRPRAALAGERMAGEGGGPVHFGIPCHREGR